MSEHAPIYVDNLRFRTTPSGSLGKNAIRSAALRVPTVETGEALMAIYDQLDNALERLEAAMRAGSMWRQETPDERALSSQEPFCADTLTMPQWLRFILVARLRALIAQRRPLPAKSQIAPAAEIYLKEYSYGARVPVIGVLREIDDLLSGE